MVFISTPTERNDLIYLTSNACVDIASVGKYILLYHCYQLQHIFLKVRFLIQSTLNCEKKSCACWMNRHIFEQVDREEKRQNWQFPVCTNNDWTSYVGSSAPTAKEN